MIHRVEAEPLAGIGRRNAGAGTSPAARSRFATLFGALLLCVLFAAAGMPRGSTMLADATRIELGERGPRGAHERAIANCRASAAPPEKRALAASAAKPRVVPRTRSIDAGGLPPPRAPTV